MSVSSKSRAVTEIAAAFVFGLTFALGGCTAAQQNHPEIDQGKTGMTTESISVAAYDSQVRQFKPEQGLAATNSNDVRLFLYDWFTHFEHAAGIDFYLSHLEDKNMSVTFPGLAPLTSHADFAKWYGNLLAQTLWIFHDVSALQIKRTAPQEFLVSFILDWYGEVKSNSDQVAGWQSRSDSFLYHHTLRQTWTMKLGDRLLIEKLVVTGGDTPSPIPE